MAGLVGDVTREERMVKWLAVYMVPVRPDLRVAGIGQRLFCPQTQPAEHETDRQIRTEALLNRLDYRREPPAP